MRGRSHIHGRFWFQRHPAKVAFHVTRYFMYRAPRLAMVPQPSSGQGPVSRYVGGLTFLAKTQNQEKLPEKLSLHTCLIHFVGRYSFSAKIDKFGETAAKTITQHRHG